MTLGFSFCLIIYLVYSQRLVSDIYVVLYLSFLLQHKHILYINIALPLYVAPTSRPHFTICCYQGTNRSAKEPLNGSDNDWQEKIAVKGGCYNLMIQINVSACSGNDKIHRIRSTKCPL